MHILYAEDEDFFRRAMHAGLRARDHTVVVVTNGQELLEQLECSTACGEEFDVILTDNQMPEMRGLEALAEIRRDQRLKDTKVVVYSSDGIADAVKGLDGIFIEKPNWEKLFATLDGIEKGLL